MEIKELGHAVLFVKDLERSVHFYRDVLGFRMFERPAGIMRGAMFSSGRTHHELLLIEVGADAPHPGRAHRAGLYHLGFKIGDDDDALRDALGVLEREHVRVVGASDHTVTHSLYILDPDDNEIELYVDVPSVDWEDPAVLYAPTKALAL